MTDHSGDRDVVDLEHSAGTGELRRLLNEQLEPVRDYLATMGIALAGIDEELRTLQRSAVGGRPVDAGGGAGLGRQIDELRRAVQDSDGGDITTRVAQLADYLEVAASHMETYRREEDGLSAMRADLADSVIAMTNRVSTEVEALRASATSHLAYVSAQIDAVRKANDAVAEAVTDTSGVQREILGVVNQLQDAVATQPTVAEAATKRTIGAIHDESSALAASIEQLGAAVASIGSLVETGNGRAAELSQAMTASEDRAAEGQAELRTLVGDLRTGVTELIAGLENSVSELAEALAATIGAQNSAGAKTNEALGEIMSGLASIEDGIGELTPRLEAVTLLEQRVADLGTGMNEHLDTTRDALIGNLNEVAEVVEGRGQRLTQELAELQSALAEAVEGRTQHLAEELAEAQSTISSAISAAGDRASEDLTGVENRTSELIHAVRTEVVDGLERQSALVSTSSAEQIAVMRSELADVATRFDDLRSAIDSVNDSISRQNLDQIEQSVIALAEASAALETSTSSGLLTVGEQIAATADRVQEVLTSVGEGREAANTRAEETATEIAELKAALVGLGRTVTALDVSSELSAAQAAIVAVVDERARNLDARTGHRIDEVDQRLASIIDGVTRLTASVGNQDVESARDAILSAVGDGIEASGARSNAIVAEITELKSALIGLGRAVDAMQIADELATVQSTLGGAVDQIVERTNVVDTRLTGVAADVERLSALSAAVHERLSSHDVTVELSEAREAIIGAVGQVAATVDDRARTLDGRTARRIEQLDSRMAAVAEAAGRMADAVASYDVEATREQILAAVGESAESLGSRAGEIAAELADLKRAMIGVGRAVDAIDVTSTVDAAREEIVAAVSAATGTVAAAFGEQDLPQQLNALQESVVGALDDRAQTLDRLSRQRVETFEERLKALAAELQRVQSAITEQLGDLAQIVQTDDRVLAARFETHGSHVAETLASIASAVATSRNELLAASMNTVEAAMTVRDDVIRRTDEAFSGVMTAQGELNERLAEVTRSSVVALDRATSIQNQLVPNIDGLAEVAMERTASVERRLDQLLSRLRPDSSTIGVAMAEAMKQAVGPLLRDVLARVDALTATDRQLAAELAAMRATLEALSPGTSMVQQGARPENEEPEPGGRRRRKS